MFFWMNLLTGEVIEMREMEVEWFLARAWPLIRKKCLEEMKPACEPVLIAELKKVVNKHSEHILFNLKGGG